MINKPSLSLAKALKSHALLQSTAGVARVTCAFGIESLRVLLRSFTKDTKLLFWEAGNDSKSILTPSAPALTTSYNKFLIKRSR